MGPSDSAAPERRFSNRVEYYIRARPRYPDALLGYFRQRLGLVPGDRLADVGSGTGFLTELFLRNGNEVFAIEPNADMRRAGEALLAPTFPDRFHSIDGSAEATTLPDRSVAFVVAGQAFHWFDPPAARREFARILSNDRRTVALVWNDRRLDDPFAAEYQKIILDFSTDHDVVRQRSEASTSDETMNAFFGTHPGAWKKASFPNSQRFDLEGFRDRVMSSSYMPLDGHPRFADMNRAVRSAFDRHQSDGTVVFRYCTVVYHGTF